MIPEKKELISFINDRKTAAAKFNVTEKTIINWMKKYDIYKPKKNYGCNKLNFEKAMEIRTLHKKGDSIKQLSSKYNVTFATISRIINNLIYIEKESKDTAQVTAIYNLENFNDQEVSSLVVKNPVGGTK
jgi:transposase